MVGALRRIGRGSVKGLRGAEQWEANGTMPAGRSVWGPSGRLTEQKLSRMSWLISVRDTQYQARCKAKIF